MHNYKALKSASKVSVAKVKVVDKAKVDEVKDGDGIVTTRAQAEQSHEELQVVTKSYDPSTGESQDDIVKVYSLSELKHEIDRCESDVASIQEQQAEWEQLEKDLKAL